MIGTPIAQKVLRLEYSLLRAPLGALDSQLTRRLPGDSRLRSTVERGLAGCDAAAARLLHDKALAKRAELSRRHADLAERSVVLDTCADELRAAAMRRAAGRGRSSQEAQRGSSARAPAGCPSGPRRGAGQAGGRRPRPSPGRGEEARRRQSRDRSSAAGKEGPGCERAARRRAHPASGGSGQGCAEERGAGEERRSRASC